jgi:hypothetical protein
MERQLPALTQAVNDQVNVLSFNQTQTGGFTDLQIEFDFRIDNGPMGRTVWRRLHRLRDLRH